MDNSILYLMHVPWGHIKQRPHFVVEYLRKYFQLNVFGLQHVSASQNTLVNNDIPSSVNVDNLTAYNVPGFINNILARKKLRRYAKSSGIVWLTSPRLHGFVKPLLTKNHIVVYDCMDDVLEFPDAKSDKKRQQKLFNLEQELCGRADIIFCSSDFLRQKLLNRYGALKVKVVNNAVNLPQTNDPIAQLPEEIEKAFTGTKKKIVYIGTISEWFDFDLLVKSLDEFDNFEYLLFGCHDVYVPTHERIKYFGPIEHKYVFSLMKRADVLIMPFIMNELILSVNPVKIYEYILSGKPALVKGYPETEKFSDYVYLYNTYDEYMAVYREIAANNFSGKQSRCACLRYSQCNTWENRISEMVPEINRFMVGDI